MDKKLWSCHTEQNTALWHSFSTLQDLRGHYFPALKFGTWASDTFRIPYYLKCRSKVGVHPTLACVSAVCPLWTEHAGLPQGRMAKPLDAPTLPHKAASPASHSGKETATKAAAVSCLSGSLILLWQFVILKSRMAAINTVRAATNLWRNAARRLFGLRSVSLMEHVS